ncbi:O-antigen ligase family protein [Chlorogloea sp. CCALA 695]|uniref:O-antigen ligase family protein n=1 Tax=Chlorogloea sp. CCALA 695 TaxID=2107693 RepID=UPI000D073861|nr:O-antigen ligase family protein [Chlorogloea sp. CCALA 695]PSB35119.1 polymerase [Chlorogloea sp. CCALA 695]
MKNEMRLDSQTEGKIIGLLVAIFYGLLTLLPDSNTQFVTWPWVFLWQAGLMFPCLWLLWQLWQQKTIQLLGNKLDWIVGLLAIILIISAAFAPYPNQARWYSWAGLCLLAALYAINNWLSQSSERYYKLLVGQGYLNLGFIIISLTLWFSQIVLPELNRLDEIKQTYNISLPFDFSIITLRNGFPIGHQNYVAGYLLLAIPLLIALSIIQSGWRRYLWVSTVILGLIDLYSTSSRGGWLGLIIVGIISFIFLLIRSNLPRLWLCLAGVAILVIFSFLVLANNRLNTLISAVLSGTGGGEFAYRIITATTGWKIGINHLIFGAAPGSVPLLYQQYRPTWAGREAELAYQLHSTPAHLWAELGLSGIAILVSAIALLIYLGFKWVLHHSQTQTNTEQIFVYSIYAGLLAYGINSLTDYQLDNICISGTIIIYIAVLATIFRPVATPAIIPLKIVSGLTLGGLGILLAMIVWLFPIHSAWNASSVGFLALTQQDNQTPEQKAQLVTEFTQRLTQANQLAPWEPYYPYQLGWNLGDRGLQTSNPQERKKLIEAGISWFTTGVKVSPNQEFGHTNLAWLLMAKGDATKATKEFARSTQLMSAKRGVFYGLGLSLLAQGKTDLGVEAMTLEALRDPIIITSPIWNSPQLKPIYTQVINRLVAKYTVLLQKPSPLDSYLRYCLGGLHWWQGNYQASRANWEAAKAVLGLQVLDLAEGKPILRDQAANKAIAAWLDPANRQTLIQSALITTNSSIPSPQLVQDLASSMDASATFEQWLKQKAPTQQYRRSRAGFGVISRHNDGPFPVDFLPVVENGAITNLFAGLLPSSIYEPQLDLALQPWRDLLLKNISVMGNG